MFPTAVRETDKDKLINTFRKGNKNEKKNSRGSFRRHTDIKIVYRCSEEELLKNQPCCRQVATTEALSKYPNSYNAFERALIKAYKFTQENKEQTVKDVKKYIDIEENLINTEVYGGYGTSVPDPDKQGTVALKNSIVELGYTEDYDIDKLYNTDIYKNALASLIKENPDDKIYAELQEHFDKYE